MTNPFETFQHYAGTQPISNGHVDNELRGLVQNRLNFDRFLLSMFGDRRRNIEQECGYKRTEEIMAQDYQDIFDREPVAARVVNVLPMECWQIPPRLFEDEDLDNKTEFETAWDELGRSVITEVEESYFKDENVNPLWGYLERADIVSGIGAYGAILFGVDDGKELSEPADLSGNKQSKLNFLRVLNQTECRINRIEEDRKNPRFGKPVTYSVTLGVPNFSTTPVQSAVSGGLQTTTKDVHWSRIQHVVDNPTGTEVGGIPRMQQVYNRLYDLHKLYGGSAEMYWQGAFPGISFETHPQLGGDVRIDMEAMRGQLVNYQQGLQRWLSMAGMSAKTLSPQVVDPTPQILCMIEAICILIGCPKRVFMGSERGELSSNQDIRAWYARCQRRQSQYVTPFLVARFVDRLIRLGCLPIPQQGFGVAWQDLASMTALEKAQVAVQETQAMSSYMLGGLFQFIAPRDFMVRVLKWEEKVADQVTEDTQDNMDEMQQAHLDQATAPPEPPGGQQNGGNQVGNRVNNTIVKTGSGYSVVSEHKGKNGKRKRLGGPYSTRSEAEKRLQEVEYFKHVGNTSGNFGHKGRPGKRGGSSKNGKSLRWIGEIEVASSRDPVKKQTRVIYNPTIKDIQQIVSKDGIARAIANPETGDVIVWGNYDITHDDMRYSLALDLGKDYLKDESKHYGYWSDEDGTESTVAATSKELARLKKVAHSPVENTQGNFGHKGRPGQVGGSGKGSEESDESSSRLALDKADFDWEDYGFASSIKAISRGEILQVGDIDLNGNTLTNEIIARAKEAEQVLQQAALTNIVKTEGFMGVFRGEIHEADFDPKKIYGKRGAIIELPAITAVSTQKDFAMKYLDDQFAGGEPHTKVLINIQGHPKVGIRGYNLRHTGLPEAILPKGAKYKVSSIKREGSVIHVTLYDNGTLNVSNTWSDEARRKSAEVRRSKGHGITTKALVLAMLDAGYNVSLEDTSDEYSTVSRVIKAGTQQGWRRGYEASLRRMDFDPKSIKVVLDRFQYHKQQLVDESVDNTWSDEARRKAIESRRRNKKPGTPPGTGARKLAAQYPSPTKDRFGHERQDPGTNMRAMAERKYDDAAKTSKSSTEHTKTEEQKYAEYKDRADYATQSSAANHLADLHKTATDEHKVASALTTEAGLVAYHTMQARMHEKKQAEWSQEFDRVQPLRVQESASKEAEAKQKAVEREANRRPYDVEAANRSHALNKASSNARKLIKEINHWIKQPADHPSRTLSVNDYLKKLGEAAVVLGQSTSAMHQAEYTRLQKKIAEYRKVLSPLT